jgi:hypothetical protein
MTTTTNTTAPAPLTRVDQVRPGQAIRFTGGHSCIVKDVRTENGYTYLTPSYGGTPYALPNAAEVYVFTTFPAAFAVEIEDAHTAALAEDAERATIATRVHFPISPLANECGLFGLTTTDPEQVTCPDCKIVGADRIAARRNEIHATRFGITPPDDDDEDAAELNEWDAADDRNED